MDELTLEEPEIVRQGNRFGVRLRAGAPSIHMIRADIETEVSPIVGTEKQSEELVHYLLKEFEEDRNRYGNQIFLANLCTNLSTKDFTINCTECPKMHSISCRRPFKR